MGQAQMEQDPTITLQRKVNKTAKLNSTTMDRKPIEENKTGPKENVIDSQQLPHVLSALRRWDTCPEVESSPYFNDR